LAARALLKVNLIWAVELTLYRSPNRTITNKIRGRVLDGNFARCIPQLRLAGRAGGPAHLRCAARCRYEVWFDKSELRGGDAWDRSIRQQIRECALFVPVISARIDARREGYFRRRRAIGPRAGTSRPTTRGCRAISITFASRKPVSVRRSSTTEWDARVP
jgi:hypothetical protein